MNLDEAAKRLGYFDADHVEKNIEAYGEPLIEWWGLIKELVNELPLNDVNGTCCENPKHTIEVNDMFESWTYCKNCDKDIV